MLKGEAHTMYLGYFEEGDTCPDCHKGKLIYPPVENCSCHINAPCSACTSNKLQCDECGFEPEEPEYKDVPITYGLCMREYKPKPLDNTKIDYRIKMHTAATQICEGVYPEGTGIDAVRKAVNGTFGGRFEYFGGGKFKFIAYTD
jgi:hypothetical protein